MKQSIFYEIIISHIDLHYRNFQSKLIPTIDKERVIGVRIPLLRKIAKSLIKTEPEKVSFFLKDLPHFYYEENLLHSFLVECENDFPLLMEKVEAFLPYIDNWAVCDSFHPKLFAKNKAQLIPYAIKWIHSSEAYTIRYGIGVLLRHFLTNDFEKDHLNLVSKITHEHYYVKMMIAWYFSMALAHQYQSTISYFENRVLDEWTHRKAIQKSIESRQIENNKKDYLRTLK